MDKDAEEGEGRVTSVFYQNANERGCVKCPYYHHHRYRRRSPRTRRSRTRRESARDARACVCPRSVAIRLSRSAFNYPSTVRGEQEISRLRSLSRSNQLATILSRVFLSNLSRNRRYRTPTRPIPGNEGEGREIGGRQVASRGRGAAGTTPRCRACRSPEALSIIIYLEA